MFHLLLFGILTHINGLSALLSIGARALYPNPLLMLYWLQLADLIHCDNTSYWYIVLFEVLILVAFFFYLSQPGLPSNSIL